MFEATVKTCRDGCQPAYCNGLAGRSEPSFGRRKRSVNGTDIVEGDSEIAVLKDEEDVIKVNGKYKKTCTFYWNSLINYFAIPK